MIDDDPARVARLRATRDRLEAQLSDPKTPPYSIAPLSNQLRLTDKELDCVHRREVAADHGLPTTPELASVVDFLKYKYRSRRPVARGTRRGLNAWAQRYEAILDSWQVAGFVTPAHAPRDDSLTGDEYREVIHAWVDECRAELTRCLDAVAQ